MRYADRGSRLTLEDGSEGVFKRLRVPFSSARYYAMSRKVMILGAGASKASPCTRAELPLPLLSDLPQVLSQARMKSATNDRQSFSEGLFRLVGITNGDIEALLTMLYQLNDWFFAPEMQWTLETAFVDRVISSTALTEFFPKEEQGTAIAILQALRSFSTKSDPMRAVFSPRNFFTLFQGSIRAYFQASIYQQPCPFHARLFSLLEHADCVTTFNYDEIADYALWHVGKLNLLSFQRLAFESIHLPSTKTPESTQFVRFLKLHGSLNWWNEHKMLSDYPMSEWEFRREGPRQSIAGGPEVHYYLGHEKLRPNQGNTPDPFILPFHSKGFIYATIPMFARHLAAFRSALQGASEIWLIGKNFRNSDRGLNGLIRFATSDRQRVLHIIDPTIDVEFHCTLFNSMLGQRFQDFREFYQSGLGSTASAKTS